MCVNKCKLKNNIIEVREQSRNASHIVRANNLILGLKLARELGLEINTALVGIQTQYWKVHGIIANIICL